MLTQSCTVWHIRTMKNSHSWDLPGQTVKWAEPCWAISERLCLKICCKDFWSFETLLWATQKTLVPKEMGLALKKFPVYTFYCSEYVVGLISQSHCWLVHCSKKTRFNSYSSTQPCLEKGIFWDWMCILWWLCLWLGVLIWTTIQQWLIIDRKMLFL